MSWTLSPSVQPYADYPASCPECSGSPSPDLGNGSGQCETCRAAFLSEDPPPGEVYILRLIPVNSDLSPLPRKERRSIEIRWGERRQADGTTAKIYRTINRQSDRYTEKVTRSDGSVFSQDEPLSHHRYHGSARTAP